VSIEAGLGNQNSDLSFIHKIDNPLSRKSRKSAVVLDERL
jgi:hypothetical protein